jgi:hypothetical protein
VAILQETDESSGDDAHVLRPLDARPCRFAIEFFRQQHTISAFASSTLSKPTGRQVRRAPHYQVGLNGANFVGGSDALIFYRIEQRSECNIRDLDIRHLYGSQGRSQEFGNLIVIKSNYRQIGWDLQAEIECPPHYTDCRHVIRTEHRRWHAGLHRVVSLHDQLRGHFQTNFLHAFLKGYFSRHGSFQTCRPGDERNAQVSQSSKVLHSLSNTVHVVDANGL